METKKLASQFLRFCISGGTGVAAGFFTLYALTEWAGVWYIFSATIAAIVNGVINFFLEKYWTFKNKNAGAIYRQGAFYAVLRISLSGADVGLMYVFVEFLHIYYLTAQIIITILLSIVSFIVCRIIFK